MVGDALRGIELIDGLVAKARLPALAAGERIGEAEGLAGEHGRRDGDLGHGLHAADRDHILRAAHHRLGGKVQRLLRRAALAVNRRARHIHRQASGEPRGARDVARLRTDGVDAAENNVVVVFTRNHIALDQGLERMRAEIDCVDVGQTTLALAGRAAQGIDNIGFCHFHSSKV